jgi:hypothetical protein
VPPWQTHDPCPCDLDPLPAILASHYSATVLSDAVVSCSCRWAFHEPVIAPCQVCGQCSPAVAALHIKALTPAAGARRTHCGTTHTLRLTSDSSGTFAWLLSLSYRRLRLASQMQAGLCQPTALQQQCVHRMQQQQQGCPGLTCTHSGLAAHASARALTPWQILQ